jgi:hypothetical protein
VSQDTDEIAGLGLTSILGIATFSERATVSLKRMPGGQAHLTTDTGVSLTTEWLHGEARCIEVLRWDRQWLDVTDQCHSGSIPTLLVKEWADRNQRTLIHFRIRL